jgi:hypothetical protein
MHWLHTGDRVRLRPREAPHDHSPDDWWTVINITETGFDAVRTVTVDRSANNGFVSHRYRCGVDPSSILEHQLNEYA